MELVYFIVRGIFIFIGMILLTKGIKNLIEYYFLYKTKMELEILQIKVKLRMQ